MEKRVALVTDWLTNFAGAEQVLLALCELFPEAPVYTSLHDPERTPQFAGREVIPSYLQKIPGAAKRHQVFTPLMPAAFESFDLKGFDIVISLGCGYSKGVITHPGQAHLYYCNTPPRYLWKIGGDTRGEGWLRSRVSHSLRIWDVASASRPDFVWGNSGVVVDRIRKVYRRDASVLYPPVNTGRFASAARKGPGDYFLSVGRLVSYKRVDLIVQACAKAGKPLVVVGEGPEEKALKGLAAGHPSIKFMGRLPDDRLVQAYAGAAAFLFAAEEDFGIVPVEAMSAGVPVIAYGKGGATETVKEGVSGTFFKEQAAASLAEALEAFEPSSYDPAAIKEWAARFDTEHFKRGILKAVDSYP